MLSASLLDDQLGQLLGAYLIDNKASKALLDGFNAPFGTFSSKIYGCSALGLISPDEEHDIQLIRKIRNDFAHQLGVSFQTKEIADRCEAFKHSAREYASADGQKFGPMSAVMRFSLASAMIAMNMAIRKDKVAAKRMSFTPWV